MPDINITVAHKAAVSDTQYIVCDNSDYTVHWTLDDEWSAYDTKTMRTIYMDGTYTDTVFSGGVVALPVCTVPGVVQIGLFAGDIRASRMAIMRALPSVRSAAGAPEDPAPDVYDQLMERMAQLETSDWAQNDPTAKDYVRNRTHYVSRESVVVVPGQEVTTAEQNNFNIAMLDNFDSDAIKTLYDSKDDTTFDVVFDGASYPCKWLEQAGNRIPVFGNFAIANPSVTDTGEPFVFSVGLTENAIMIAIVCKVAGTHTVAVSCQQDVVHTLDPKYIKDMYYTGSEEMNIAGVQITGSTYDGTEHDPLPFALGQVWNADFETTSYNDLHVKQADDGTLYIGDLGLSSPPFFVSVTSGGANSAWNNNMQPGGLTLIGVSGTVVGKVVHTLPDEYLSANIARKSDIPENRIMITTMTPISTNISVDFGGYTDVLLLIKATTPGQFENFRYMLVNGKNKRIINCKTGSAVVDGEQPYGVMAIMCDVMNDTYTLLNPL